MPLTPGSRLGAYEVLSLIGSGGMGEVYRARDPKLDRDVAIKVLPESLATDPERLARFEREARTLAAMNHPNIAHIYGAEDSTGVPALVMELVEGPTLADRIAKSALPLDEALPIAKQIAEALEAAHEQGIIHRDLKPANIKVRPDGTVKVLDFGLAKVFEPASAGAASATMSPTLSMRATQAGLILGTAAYMSPEQAAGRPVDRRSDLWAFGVVLLEMLTGRQVFDGETVSHVLASVLKDEPPWAALPAHTPASIRRLLRRCLEKDRKRRLADAADARLELDEALASRTDETVGPIAVPTRRVASTAIAALAGAAVVGLAMYITLRPVPVAPGQPMRFTIVPPPAHALTLSASDRDLALSPDGRHLVYVSGAGADRIAGTQLMVRTIDHLESVAVGGGVDARSPFLSPDGRWIGFFSADLRELKKLSIDGGAPISICRTLAPPRGASWSPDGTIVFATSDPLTGLLSVPDTGGEPRVLTKPDGTHGVQDHAYPAVLPGGRAVLFTIMPSGPSDGGPQVAVLDLNNGAHKILVRGGSQAVYVDAPAGAGKEGYLVYVARGALHAARFDPVRLEVSGDPVPVVENVVTKLDWSGEFAVSRNGTLVYVPGGSVSGSARSLTWVDRQGHEEPIKAPPRAYFYPRLSPDGTRVALDTRDLQNDIWIWDLARETLARLTDDPASDWYPVWTPESRRIMFASNRAGNLNVFWQPSDNTGTVERLTSGQNAQFPTSISPDGTRLIFTENAPNTGRDIHMVRIASPASGPPTGESPRGSLHDVQALIRTPFNEDNGEISPDGRWLAYQSDDTGQNQIHVRPFPNVDSGHWQISTNGGSKPLWARSGKELFYLDATNALTAVAVQTDLTFAPGNPVKLFDGRHYPGANGRAYDVSPDGKRFLMINDSRADDQRTAPATMVMVLNWSQELKARLLAK